jgi:hypothetical protein
MRTETNQSTPTASADSNPAVRSTRLLDGVLPGENVLPDDYPVHWEYLYVCDARVRVSPIGGGGTVADLKRELNAREVRSCDIAARHLWD